MPGCYGSWGRSWVLRTPRSVWPSRKVKRFKRYPKPEFQCPMVTLLVKMWKCKIHPKCVFLSWWHVIIPCRRRSHPLVAFHLLPYIAKNIVSIFPWSSYVLITDNPIAILHLLKASKEGFRAALQDPKIVGTQLRLLTSVIPSQRNFKEPGGQGPNRGCPAAQQVYKRCCCTCPWWRCQWRSRWICCHKF